jgi:hypothetical protein
VSGCDWVAGLGRVELLVTQAPLHSLKECGSVQLSAPMWTDGEWLIVVSSDSIPSLCAVSVADDSMLWHVALSAGARASSVGAVGHFCWLSRADTRDVSLYDLRTGRLTLSVELPTVDAATFPVVRQVVNGDRVIVEHWPIAPAPDSNVVVISTGAMSGRQVIVDTLVVVDDMVRLRSGSTSLPKLGVVRPWTQGDFSAFGGGDSWALFRNVSGRLAGC